MPPSSDKPERPARKLHEPSADHPSPLERISLLKRLSFAWLDPLFRLGWKRPLELGDIWQLPGYMRVELLAGELEQAWADELAQFPEHDPARGVSPVASAKAAEAAPAAAKADSQANAKAAAAAKGPSLRRALWKLLFRKLFPIGIVKFLADICGIASPLIVKLVIAYVASARSGADSPIGTGIAYAIALLLLQLLSTTFLNLFFFTTFAAGIAVRSAFTGAIFRKSMRLSAAARQDFSSGKVTNLVSTDTQRLELFFALSHFFWTASVQIVIIVALLISQLGWAALAGLVLLAALVPIQDRLFRVMSKIREEVAPLTDKRVRLTQEGIQGIRVLKFFAWEKPFLQQIEELRHKEVRLNLKKSIVLAFLSTLAFAIPSFSASIAFIIYSVTAGGSLEPARIFSALAWFNQIPFPLMFLPQVFSAYADATVAIKRIQELLLAPEIEAPATIDPNASNAVEIVDGEFNWDSMPPSDDSADAADGTAKAKAARPPRWFLIKPKGDKDGGEELEPVSDSSTVTLPAIEEAPKSTLRNINIAIPRGKLVAVVGSVGSGKSSLLNALVGEMKRVKGTVTFSSRLGYAPQQAWIQNASVKDNILFGQPFDEERYHAAIRDCSLEKDLEILADGDLTQIGERGINLSGGQKQRVNLARMVYFNADIVLLDDPLSAVDAHVGRALFDNCIQGALAGKTRILVTHQLHFLPRVDYVIVMSDGEVSEQGTFSELMAADGEFATLMRSYGGVEDAESDDAESSEGGDAVEKTAVGAGSRGNAKGVIADADKKDVRELMQSEERATGTVDKKVWASYFRAAGGFWFGVGVVVILAIMQGSQSANNIWLAIWSSNSIPNFDVNKYIGVFAGIGAFSAITNFIYGVFFAFKGTRAGRVLHESALKNIFRAPVGFFDTTPLGRIINRFSKDQDGIDTTLIDAFRSCLETLIQSIASFALIIYATPLFAIPFVPVLCMYFFVQLVFRNTSRELKRLDSITRSPLYASIGETLNGIATVRAYREQERFVLRNNQLVNINIAPYFLVFGATRWLSLRFESLGTILVFFTALFGILSRNNPSFSPAFFGLAITYSLQISMILNWCIRQFTDTEIAMNAVERVEFYAHRLELEAPEITDVRPPADWPAKGEIEFKDVSMRYAADLPLVLKSVSFSIRDKEKIGVVGRTGSGKSSLMQVLFRMVEPASGAIVVDGITTSELGLKDLRSGLGIIPQDPVLFSGTFRRNLDPFGEHTDAELWDALERANIKAKVAESEGGLDGEVHENGENLSVGQRQLVCLARAMLKKPRVLVMDEATANVDYETDAIIQKCLRQDFGDSTVLTIAHRLNTIVDYDRVMVLSAGEIVEFDTPQALVAKEGGVFRSMVDETGPQNVELIHKQLFGESSSSDGTILAPHLANGMPPSSDKPERPARKLHEPSADHPSPLERISLLKRLSFAWLDPLFRLGWKRPLELGDIWQLPGYMRVELLAGELEQAWADELAQFPEHDPARGVSPVASAKAAEAAPAAAKADSQANAKAAAAAKGPSLRRALWKLLFRKLFPIGIVKFLADICGIASPLIVKLVIAYVASARSGADSPIGTGIAYAIALLLLQLLSTTFLNLFFFTTFAAGIAVRSAFTGAIFRKSMRLSAAARQDFSSGKVTNLVSTDTQRLELFFALSHFFWTASVQIVIIVALLISQLGWAALAGLVLLAALVPIQDRLFRVMSKIREEVAPLTDKRVRLTQEGIQGIRVLKFFAWEKPFLQQIEELRHKEVRLNLKKSIVLAFLSTLAFAIPSFSASIAFIIYSVTAGGSLEPARIFSALAWFNQIPFPLMFLPQVFSAYADATVAIKRIQELLLAPEIEAPATIDPNASNAVEIVDGEFNWDSMPPSDDSADAADGTAKAKAARPPRWFLIKPKGDKDGGEELEPVSDSSTVTLPAIEEAPKSTLRNINIAIPRGKLVAVVGSVGSGKSSLLNALVGEMKRVKGTVTFSSRLGYAPQQAWIQNASVKDNILFGQPFDEERYHAAIRDCSLEKDLEILADGDLTQIGERGINLSGGQKQRVNLARMVYFNADIVLLDDPLSAVDAHVGRALFDNCIQGALAGKTRILVTHQLHFLPRVDYVIVMSDGEVSEQGTFSELMAADGEFATLMRSYGGVEDAESDDAESSEGGDAVEKTAVGAGSRGNAKGVIADADKKDVRELMQSEERATGTVDKKVWASYFRAAGGFWFGVGVVVILAIMQGSQSANNIWLAIWSSNSIPNFDVNKYIGVFAGIGAFSAITNFIYGVFFAFKGTRAGRVLHESALKNIFRAPVGFFDTTPLGRIINRFSKDQDGIDTTLIDAFRSCLETLIQSIASFALIIYATPLFAIPFVPVLCMYFFVQLVFRNTSRELKRLDSITRSPLYASIGETLNGIATVRAYREQERFVLRNNQLVNINIAPYFLVFGATRWLSLRFESLGTILVFFTALFGILSRNNPSFSPAFFGLAITYSLQISMILNWCIRQFTDTEIAMNAVERVEFYAHRLELEAPEITDVRPPADWPAKGEIEFKDVSMRYAADLPLVLKSVSFSIRDKEKIGVVGRTGSGKSSLMQVLFRMVEPASGAIVVDGITTSELGLKDLRSGLGIIPQDPVLFSGTFRRNLDPFGEHTDAELWDALERANIKAKVAESDGGLDGEVHENGENLSVGQRQLVCLARAMLKKPRVLVMDEATANVDYETDAIIQKCLRQDFGDSTVLTIAHRLNTIVDYDRVMVLSAGEIVEFDTPQALVAKEGGVFRSMVDETGPQNVEAIMRILNADARDA